MTSGERMVFAAAFAQYLLPALAPPRGPATPGREKEWREHEENVTHQAIEAATGAVERLRAAIPGIVDGFGSGSMEARFCREMING